MPLALKAFNLTKSFLIGTKMFKIIDDINLEIETGTFVSIMGRSGSGKTTLLNLLMGIISLDNGINEIDGKIISDLNDKELSIFRAEKIGIVFQDNNLLTNFNVEENIILPLLICKKDVDKLHLDELLELIGLKEHRHHDVNNLSGGQKQKVAIARALINNPTIIFADEPTGSLDSASANEIMNLFKKINKEYKTTIIQVTHSLECAQAGHQIITLQDGKIIEIKDLKK